MTVKKVPVKFKAHGEEFDTEEEAKLHDEFVEASRALTDARKRFQKSLAKCQKTADGKRFELGLFKDYYFVRPGWWGMPALVKVDFWGDNFTVIEEQRSVRIIRRDTDGKQQDYSISELYANHSAAERALLAAQEEWLKAQEAAIQETRDKVNAG